MEKWPLVVPGLLNMKKSETDELLDEYDFPKEVREKYAEWYHLSSNVVVLEPDVAEFFPNSEAVNQALRSIHAITNR